MDMTRALNQACDRLEGGHAIYALPKWASEIIWFASRRRGMAVDWQERGGQVRITAQEGCNANA